VFNIWSGSQHLWVQWCDAPSFICGAYVFHKQLGVQMAVKMPGRPAPYPVPYPAWRPAQWHAKRGFYLNSYRGSFTLFPTLNPTFPGLVLKQKELLQTIASVNSDARGNDQVRSRSGARANAAAPPLCPCRNV